MNIWTEVRRKVLVEGVSKRQVIRNYKIGAATLERMLSHSEPPGYRQVMPRERPKLGPHLAFIDEILESDRSAPPKQRHTARRIYDRLRDERGYDGGDTQVRDYVSKALRYQREVFVPLSHPPGEAQYDFGESTVIIAGVVRKAAVSVMTLPYSDVFHISAYPRECTETFQAGHIAAFRFLGGVPTRITYDNSAIAVTKITGALRDLTVGFLALASHFLFAHHFCRPARGNEKGHVEGGVGFSRRNFMVPVPEAPSWEALNERLEAQCRAGMNRSVRGKREGKAERFITDSQAFLPLPEAEFNARRVAKVHANSLSLVRFDTNDYSVPTAFAHHELTASGGVGDVVISDGTEVVATHKRCWEREQVIFDPRHYLALLERKPGAFDHARPLEDWDLPDVFDTLRRRLVADDPHGGGMRDYIKVLRLLEKATVSELAGAITAALDINATGVDAISLILAHRKERPVELFSLDGLPHLKSVSVDDIDLGVYDQLADSTFAALEQTA
jgi:transposase